MKEVCGWAERGDGGRNWACAVGCVWEGVQLAEDTDDGGIQVSGTTCGSGLGNAEPVIAVFLLDGCAT